MSSDSTDKLTDLPDGEYARTIWDKVQLYFNTINHVIIGIISIYMSFICYRAGGTLYNWHAWLCTIGVGYWNLNCIETEPNTYRAHLIIAKLNI